jgi:hypothetical protein
MLEKSLPVEIRAIKEFPQEITIGNEVLSENMLARILFLTFKSRGT